LGKKQPATARGTGPTFRVGRLVVGYIVLAGLWIIFSDVALERVWPERGPQLAVSIFKGLTFVTITAILLGWLLHRERERFYRTTARQIATTAALIEHFRALSERTSDAVLLVDEKGQIIDANEAAIEALGWSHAALCTRSIDDIEVFMGDARHAKRPTSYESIIRMADGRMLPAVVDVLTLQFGARELRTFIIRSIPSQAQSAGRHRDRSWIDVFFDMPFIGMAITSPETKRWVRFNDRLCEILGYPREELTNVSWAEITHPDDLEKDIAEFQSVMNGEADGYRMEKRFIRKNGDVVHAQIDVRCRRLPDGSVDYFVATIQDVTERVHAEHRLRRQKNLYAALSRINTAMTRLPDRSQMFQEVCDAVVGIGRFKFAWIFSIGEGEHEYRFEAEAGEDQGFIRGVIEAPRIAEELERSAPVRAIRSGKPLVCDPYAEDPGTVPWRAIAAAANIAASGTFPIVEDGRVIAVLIVYSGETGVFDSDIVRLLEEMARDVAFAIANRRREDARVATLSALEAAEVRARFALEGAGHGAWEWNLETDRVAYASLWKRLFGYAEDEISDSPEEWTSRIHPDDFQATLGAVQDHLEGRSQSYMSEHRLRCKDGSYKWVLDRGKVLERDAGGRPLKFFGTKTDLSGIKATESALFQEQQRMDLARTSARIGTWEYDIASATVHLHHHTAALFGFDEAPRSMSLEEYRQLLHPDDRERLVQMVERHLQEGGEYVSRYRFMWPDGSVHWVEERGLLYHDEAGQPVSAFGINMDISERVEAEEKIRDYVARLERSMLGTVDAISHMVELRDPYTAGHERRVGQLAYAIGHELGLDTIVCQGLEIIGRVHDIGKITIPAEILSKPGRLSEMEMNIVRTHAEQGYEILKDTEFDWPVAEVIRQHHERIDGSGYPRGLAGDEILLERIMAVADVVESMASHRPYRASLGIERALVEIESKAGLLFDPDVVGACIRLFRERNYTFEARSEG
jgi:PAS domain S-box-containing protein